MTIRERLQDAMFPAPEQDQDAAEPPDAPYVDALPPDPPSAHVEPESEPELERPTVRKRRTKRTTSRSAPSASAAQRRQVQDSVELLLTLGGGTWSMRDQVCGPALSQVAADTAKAAAPIICRNPALLKWFTGSSLMDVMALGVALQPFVRTVIAHHITHSIGGELDSADYSGYSAPDL